MTSVRGAHGGSEKAITAPPRISRSRASGSTVRFMLTTEAQDNGCQEQFIEACGSRFATPSDQRYPQRPCYEDKDKCFSRIVLRREMRHRSTVKISNIAIIANQVK